MPFSEEQIQRHIEYLEGQVKKEMENEVDQSKIEEEMPQLYMIVLDEKEAEEHNLKLKMAEEERQEDRDKTFLNELIHQGAKNQKHTKAEQNDQ